MNKRGHAILNLSILSLEWNHLHPIHCPVQKGHKNKPPEITALKATTIVTPITGL